MSERFERLCADPAFQEMFRNGHRRHVPKGQVILREGDAPRSLYFVMSGSVSVHMSNWRGDSTLLAVKYPGEFFGEMGLFPGQSARCASVAAASESNLLEIAYTTFLELTHRHHALWIELAGQLAAQLRSANRQIAEMPQLQVKDRVWQVVSELAERAPDGNDPGGVALRIRREDLGMLAGCSREAAGNALQELAGEGRLRLHGQAILVGGSKARGASPARA